MLRGDIVKDDSGACAVFTEQSSPAPEMTAAKNHGCYCKITRLCVMNNQLMQYPRTFRLNWEMLPDCSEFQSQNVQTYGCVSHDKNGQNHAQTLKIQWYFSNEYVWTPISRIVLGNAF